MNNSFKRLLSLVMVVMMVVSMMPTTVFAAEADTATVDTVAALKAALAEGGEITVSADITVDEALTIPENATLTINEGKTLRVLNSLTNNGIINGAGKVAVSIMVYVVEEKENYNVTATKNGAITGTAPACTVAYEISLDGGENWISDTTNGKAQAVTVKTDGTTVVSSSFQSAFTSALTGETVHMLKDAHVQSTNTKKNNGPLRSYYGLILEGNGHTIYTDLESSGASNEYATIKFTSYLAGTGPEVNPVLKNVTIDSQKNAKADLDYVSGDVTFTVTMYNVNLLGNCQYASFAMKSPSMIVNKSNVEIYDCAIPSWDAGSANQINLYSGEYSLTLNSKCTVYGGTYTKDVSNYLADGCVMEKDASGKYVVAEDTTPVADLIISNAEDLIAFAKDVNENKNEYSDKLVVLANDIDLAGSEENLWTPIGASGDSAPKFRGTFDGQGHTIKNLYVKQGAAYHAAGLFGATNGTIQNLIVDGAYVESLSSGSATVNGTAVVAGSTAYGATINNVHVKNATVKGNRYVAGIVGYMDGTVKDCSVENLILIATPDDLTGSYDNGDKVGGIVGYCNSNAVEISGCELKGEVDITAYRDVAGLVGCASTGVKINNNTNSAAVVITIDQITNSYGEKTPNAGEFIGRNTPAEAAGNTTAEGASYTQNTATAVTYVAEVNGTQYESLQEAIDAADGNTVTLLTDIELTEGVTVAAGKTVTLALNGNTITGKPAEAKAFSVITNKGNLTIKGNGSVVCDHQLTGSTGYAVNTITNSGTLTIDGATIENKSTASNQIGYAIDNNSTTGDAILVVKSGDVKAFGSNYYDGIRLFCNNLTKENSVSVEGGTVFSIWLQNPSDGTTEKDTKDVKGSVSVTGGTVKALYLEPSSAFEAEITSGDIGKVEYFTTSEGRDLTGFVSGGTFGAPVAEEFCAEGYIPADNGDGTYGVREETFLVIVVSPVATMSTTTVTVATMDEAVAYAQANPADNVTYQIVGPVELTTGFSHGIIDLGSNVTIEGVTDEAKLTIVGGGVPDFKGVTFKNLTIADEGTYLPTANEFMYQNFIDCTFEDVTFEDGIRLSGTTTITNCTVNANTANEYAIWLDEGDFTMTVTTVTAGSDAYGLIKSDEVDTITLTGNTFEYLGAANKEALNVKNATITASGNTFIDCTEGIIPADKTNYAADGSALTEAAVIGENTVKTNVAKIGDTKYESLAEALAATVDNDTVTILSSTSETIGVPAGNNVTITAIEGVELSGGVGGSYFNKSVTLDGLTFKGGKGVALTAGVAGLTYTIKNCIFDGVQATGWKQGVISLNGNATVVVENNTITNVQNATEGDSRIDSQGQQSVGLYVNNANNVTVTGNTISGVDGTGINVACTGTMTITENTISDWGTGATAQNEGRAIRVSGGTDVVISENVMIDNGTAQESFVKATGAAELIVSANYWDGNDPMETGVFESDKTIDPALILLSYYTDAEKTNEVQICASVAKVDGTYYDSLIDALKAVKADSVVEILADVTIDEYWDARYTGGKITVPVTINGNDHTIKFTNTVYDGGNYMAAFRFEDSAVVNDLTIDMSQAQSGWGTRIRAISAKGDLTVDGCTFIGNGAANTTRAVIFGEGAGTNIGNVVVSITNSTFKDWGRGISDNENAQDAKALTITGNTFTDASVNVSADESITFNDNVMNDSWAKLVTYNSDSLSVTAQGNTLTSNGTTSTTKNYIYAKTVDAQEGFIVEHLPYMVSTKAELDAALAAVQAGDTIILTADIDYGTTQLAINKAITLDLGGFTLTTCNAYGGMSVKGNPTIKNGTIVHASNTSAIKVWNAAAFEDLVIDVQGKGDANKTIGGIVLQSGTTTCVGSIKNVTIKGDALTNGIETYNCGDASEDVIGSMENVTIDAKGTGMLISAPCGTATNCSISGDVNGIEIWIKGTYSAKLDLVGSTVEGGVLAHDEYSSNPSIVNNGTLSLTADSATTGASMEDVTLTIARAENVDGVLKDVMDHAVAKVNDTYYLSLADAFAAAQDGDEVIILQAGTYALSTSGKDITITGAVDGIVFDNIGAKRMDASVTFNNVTFDYYPNVNYTGLQHSGDLVYNNCTFNGQVFLYGTSETFNNCTFNQNSADAYNVWTYSAAEVNFNGCTFNCAGKSVLIYHEGASVYNEVNVTDSDFIASAPVAGKAAIEMDSSLTAGITLTIDADTTVTGFGTGNVSGISLWNNKKGNNTDANNDITVIVAGETVLAPVTFVAQVGETKYSDLHEAMVACKAGETVLLIADVDLAGTEWEPVSFKGTFDGQDHTISNLTINKPGVSNIGFITSLNGTFKNVTFTNPTVTGGENTGVIAGRAGGSASLAENITVNGTIKVEVTHSGYARAAVIVGGWAYGNYKNITVDGGDKAVSYVKHTGGGDGRYVGGIVGHADDVDSYVNCTVKNITIDGDWLCGAIAGPGPSDGLASGCAVENVDIHADYSGGMFGWYYGSGTIENSSIKNVAFTAGTTKNGAIGGYSANPNANVVNVTIENVTNQGEALLEHVAEVNSIYYFTLAEAVAAAQDGETVTLLTDIELTDNDIVKVGNYGVMVNVEGKSITLDMNGKTIDVNYAGGKYLYAVILVADGAELTVTGDGTIDVSENGRNVAYMFWKRGTTGALTIKNGTYHMNDSADSMVYTNGHEIVTVEGGNFTLDTTGTRENGAPWIFNVQGAGDHCVIVTGGTYNADINRQHWSNEAVVPKTHYVVKNSDNTWTVMEGAVAYVNEGMLTGPYFAPKDVGYATLQEALDASKGEKDIVINLLDDVTLDITAWQTLAIGGETTETITINGNGKTLTFNKLNSDWNHITTNNDAKLILNDMTITDSGKNNGPWNRYDLNFACDVELNNVTSTKALAFKADATLNTVTVNETGDNYAIWVQANGQTVTIDGLTVNSAGRGIKIDNQYVDQAAKVTLNVSNATFDTAKKAAIMVKNPAGADITVSNVDISDVAADAENVVWNDEDNVAYYSMVNVTGGTKAQEGEFPAVVKDAEGNIRGYYKTLADAFAAAVEGDTIELLAPVVVNAGETLTLDKAVTITYTSNVAGEDMITNRGTLVIDGTTLVYVNTDTTASNVTVSTISCEPGSVLEVKSGVVKNDSANYAANGIYAYAIDILTNGNLGDVTATISGGEIISTNYMAIRQFNNGEACKNTLNVTGGKIYGAKRAIQVHLKNNAAYTNITGGEIEGGEYALCFLTTSENLTVSGGKFTGSVWYSGTDGFISGGTFDEAVAEEYCAEGYIPMDNGDGTYGVKLGKYVAEVGGIKYETLAEAMAAAQANDIITLYANIAEDEIVIAKKPVTINANGFTITEDNVACMKYVNGEGEKVQLTCVETEEGLLIQTARLTAEEAGNAVAYIDVDGSGTLNAGEELTTLQAALNKAAETAGEGNVVTVRLTGDPQVEGTIILPGYVTLDIQANEVHINTLVGLKNSIIKGTPYSKSDDHGQLVVDPANMILAAKGFKEIVNGAEYDIIPIYNAGHFVFSRMRVNSTSSSTTVRGLRIDEEAKTIKFQFATSMTGDVRKNILVDGNDDNEVKFIVRLTWDTIDEEGNFTGTAYQDFVYSNEQVSIVCDAENQPVTREFALTITGYDALEIDISTLNVMGMVITNSGVEVSG